MKVTNASKEQILVRVNGTATGKVYQSGDKLYMSVTTGMVDLENGQHFSMDYFAHGNGRGQYFKEVDAELIWSYK